MVFRFCYPESETANPMLGEKRIGSFGKVVFCSVVPFVKSVDLILAVSSVSGWTWLDSLQQFQDCLSRCFLIFSKGFHCSNVLIDAGSRLSA